ncbi:hypothetical protein BKA69DRAFT_599371 [Paraphysoderma sedebokerense]|nr:hypothetical protein BKA69DRAFT_599371 [Paraphysoderma sedebokerense]
MPNLTVLDLSHNHLTSIPTSIRHCKKLISLNVAGNQIDSVPFCLLNLPYLRKLRLSDNPLRTECPLPQRRSPPSLFELSARTILNSPELNSMDISDMIPESMKGYFSQAKRCDHVSCRQWYVGDEVKRYKAVERGEERIVAWWGLCNAHWWDEEERIRSLFVKSANTVGSSSNGTGRSNHFQNCYKAACRHSAKRLHSSSCIPPPASTENALFPPTLGLGPSTPTAKTDSKPASLPTKLRRHFSQSMLPPAFSQASLSSLTELESSSTLPPLPPLPVRESPVKSNLKRFVTKQSKRLSMDSKKLLSDKAKVKLNADVPSARNGRSNNANNHRNSNSRSRSRSRSTPAPPPTPSGLHTPLSNSIPPSPTLPPRSPSLSIIPPQSFNISSSASLSRPQSNSRSNSPLPSPSNHQRSSSPTTAVPPSPSRADSITSLPLPPSLSASFSSSSSSSSSASSPSESVITLVSSYPEEILETEIIFDDSNSDQLSEKWSGKLKLKGKHVVGNVKRFLSPSENFKNQWSGMRKDLKMVWRRG